MSRDKYGEDHTITVDEGNGTLTVDGNLALTGGFDIDSLTLVAPVTQRLRYLGVAFRPDDGDDTNQAYNISTGRLTFNSTVTTAMCPVVEVPHGATITSIRLVGAGEGISDQITVALHKADGSTSAILASIVFSNNGFSITDTTTALSVPELVDFTEDKSYHFLIQGQQTTTAGHLNFVDVIYTIQSFPQDSESSPT